MEIYREVKIYASKIYQGFSGSLCLGKIVYFLEDNLLVYTISFCKLKRIFESIIVTELCIKVSSYYQYIIN